MKQMSFAAAMKDYFGYLPNGNAASFMQELRALNEEDRKWFRDNLPKVGYEIVQVASA